MYLLTTLKPLLLQRRVVRRHHHLSLFLICLYFWYKYFKISNLFFLSKTWGEGGFFLKSSYWAYFILIKRVFLVFWVYSQCCSFPDPARLGGKWILDSGLRGSSPQAFSLHRERGWESSGEITESTWSIFRTAAESQ